MLLTVAKILQVEFLEECSKVKLRRLKFQIRADILIVLW